LSATLASTILGAQTPTSSLLRVCMADRPSLLSEGLPTA
jgi:hypothetical protein